MSEPREHTERGGTVGQHPAPGTFTDDHAAWEGRTRVFLQPVAAPSILGLFGFAGATMMVGAWQAGWYGGAATPLVLFPFALTFGGLAQFLAGMWSYRARDGLATAIHGMWGAFWLAWGLLFLLIAIGSFPLVVAPSIGVTNTAFAFWFIPLCVITALGALAALGRNLAQAALLLVLAAGAGFTAAGFWTGSTWPLRTGGWLFVIAAGLAVYVAASMMLEETYGRTILPLGKYRQAANVPGRRASRPLEYRYGEPGVRVGQ
ncbi:hypothetical protein Acsp03_02110 [Actinomadura sp. NBRC 104412]|uniref:acetate uptake transporter family protein n=1 Tax=Actinomadura sp. NBRC 104412 TaxID=3032203 RepID=UPI0024A5C7CE|nr:GPR1/FUN34/YaaH family transporter [Actinomadura sp. NBRC 104412]GLZ02744.1 hypothetical protein Acsp03_02110 [Actinomadura sp. NBRC 104412]